MRLSVGTLRQVVKRDLPIAFVPQQLTSYGGLELLRRYVRRIELPRRLHGACAALAGLLRSSHLNVSKDGDFYWWPQADSNRRPGLERAVSPQHIQVVRWRRCASAVQASSEGAPFDGPRESGAEGPRPLTTARALSP